MQVLPLIETSPLCIHEKEKNHDISLTGRTMLVVALIVGVQGIWMNTATNFAFAMSAKVPSIGPQK